MRISDLIKMCVQNLRRRKFRTFLTVVGVVIGTAAIISMISLGIGINKNNDDLISQWGDLSIINVYGGGSDTPLNDNALSEISMMDGVDGVSPFTYLELQSQIISGKKGRYVNPYPSVSGVYPSSLSTLDYKLKEGEIVESDGRGKTIPVLFGQDVAYEFTDKRRDPYNNTVSPYPNEFGEVSDPFIDPLKDDFILRIIFYDKDGKEKNIDYNLKVTGIIASGDLEFSDSSYRVYMDTNDVVRISKDYEKISKEKLYSDINSYNHVKVRVSDLEKVSIVQKSISDMSFYTDSIDEQRKAAMKNTQQMQVILGGLGAVSLLVAAISIANTMVMSVYERTKEIGIMKVLGCFVSDIRSIFLVEATLIGFIGGIIGVGLSYLISYIINTFGGTLGESMGMLANWNEPEVVAKLSIIPPWLVLLGMVFATTIGIAAGFYPAARAVRISALEAIRQD